MARIAGLTLGAGLATLAVGSWQVAGGTQPLGTDVTLVANSTGELEVSPLEPVVLARDLHPGPPRSRQVLTVRNQTASVLEVSLRTRPAARDLDSLLRVSVRADDTEIFRGPLGRLRSWSAGSVRLGSGDTTLLETSVWLPASVGEGYSGLSETLDLEFRSVRLGG